MPDLASIEKLPLVNPVSYVKIMLCLARPSINYVFDKILLFSLSMRHLVNAGLSNLFSGSIEREMQRIFLQSI